MTYYRHRDWKQNVSSMIYFRNWEGEQIIKDALRFSQVLKMNNKECVVEFHTGAAGHGGYITMNPPLSDRAIQKAANLSNTTVTLRLTG